MANLIPKRPLYRKERIWVGFPTLAVFALLFLVRLVDQALDLPFSAVWVKLLAIPAVFLVPTVIFCLVRGYGYTRVLRIRSPRATCGGYFTHACGMDFIRSAGRISCSAAAFH